MEYVTIIADNLAQNVTIQIVEQVAPQIVVSVLSGGIKGTDGYTPIKDIDYFDGTNGTNGIDGIDGVTPVKGVDYFDGANGTNGINGADGYTPIKGTDYFDGIDGVDGVTQDISGKVDKVTGYSLTKNDLTDALKSTYDDKISFDNISSARLANTSGTNTGDQTIPTTLPASDVYAWAKATVKPSYTKTEVGLSNVPNTDFTTAVGLNTAKIGITAQQASDITANNAKVGVTTEIKPTDIDTLAELNAIITDATLIDTTDARLSDARTPLAHTQTASTITDFDTGVANNTAVVANTAKISFDSTSSTRLADTSGSNTGDNAVNTLYSALETNATHSGEVIGATALTIASGVVDIDNLKTELKTTTDLGSVSGTVNIDCILGIHFKMVLTGAITSLTFSNYATQQNKTITLELTGNFTITQPATVKGDWTAYDGTKTNQIQIYLFNVTTPVFSSALINW